MTQGKVRTTRNQEDVLIKRCEPTSKWEPTRDPDIAQELAVAEFHSFDIEMRNNSMKGKKKLQKHRRGKKIKK